MRFDGEWIRALLEAPPTLDEIAERLTACGLLVELREPLAGGESWDVDVTTNRPDAMNHRGLAREAAVATGGRLVPLEHDLREDGPATAELARVEIEAPAACRRFCARVIRGVRPASSPDWLRQRLERCGVRPISAVVDVTNYVLLALGQPLHAYDLARVAGARLVARMARPGEILVTLDGERRVLDESMPVIADDDGPVGLAGVMGGADSEISDATSDVLLEAANFEPLAVRRMARRLGMHTEASHRFERGADPALPPVAVDLAAAMIAQLAGGTVCRGRIDVHPRPAEARTVDLTAADVSAFAGLVVEPAEVRRILAGLGFEPTATGDVIHCTVPSWRVDVERSADLYEEVIRHVGYGRIPALLPVLSTAPGRRHDGWRRSDRMRDAAVAAGLDEVMTYSFIAAADDAVAADLPLAGGGPQPLANPLARTQDTMRRSLLPGLLAAVRETLNQGEERVAVFELGRVFWRDAEDRPQEADRLAVVLAGGAGGWGEPELDFALLKGRVEAILAGGGFPPVAWRRGGAPWLDEAEGALLTTADERVVGCVGRLAAPLAERWDLRHPGWVAELEPAVAGAEPPAPVFRELPRFPAVTMDVTVEHDRSLAHAELLAAVHELADRRVVGVRLQDRFSGEGVGAGRVRTTLRLVYRDPGRSLTQDEVNGWHQRLREQLMATLAVQLV